MFKPIEVKVLANYRIWLNYSDGTQGEVDLSHLAGKGVFTIWDNYENFEHVVIGEHGEIAWNNDIDLCPDTLYMKITGKSPEQLFPNLNADHAGNKSILWDSYQNVFGGYDHMPPHFHAEYGSQEVVINVSTLAVVTGKLSPRAMGLVMEWDSIHQQELIDSRLGESKATSTCRQNRSTTLILSCNIPSEGLG